MCSCRCQVSSWGRLAPSCSAEPLSRSSTRPSDLCTTPSVSSPRLSKSRVQCSAAVSIGVTGIPGHRPIGDIHLPDCACHPAYLSVQYLCECLSDCLSVCLSLYLSVQYLCDCLFVSVQYLCDCLFVSLSFCLLISVCPVSV